MKNKKEIIAAIVIIPKPQSIIYPKTKGDRALANTAPACNNALTVPKLFTPYTSAHREPIKGVEMPMLKPYRLM